ncbi:unnamed protein product [Urochloa humidicola]
MNHQQDGEKVKLLGFWASPYVFRVIWALRIKGIEYDYIEEDLENKSSQLLEYNPVHKKVPVLLYRGEPVAESEVILEFIDEAWKDRGHRILPEDPYERAMARFWARFLQDKDCYRTIRKIDKAADTYSNIRGKETPFALYSHANGFMPRKKPEEKQRHLKEAGVVRGQLKGGCNWEEG